jgi:hypothetical protein
MKITQTVRPGYPLASLVVRINLMEALNLKFFKTNNTLCTY